MTVRLRVGTWNVHQWTGRGGRPDMDRAAAVLAGLDMDLAGLQEASMPYPGPDAARRESGLEPLERRLGMRAVAGPTLRRTHGRFGNVLLTRLDVDSVELHDISVAGREPRGVIDAVLVRDGLRLRALVSHLGLGRAERRVQSRVLAELLRLGDRGLPTVLLADCNEWNPWSTTLRRLEAWFGSGPARRPRTWPSRLPLFALDRVFCRPVGLAGRPWAVATPRARAASDHLPLAAELDMEEGG